MSLGPLSPSPDEIVIQRRTNHRTSNWDQTAGPFFDRLFARLDRDPLNHLGHESIDDFFFQQLAADIYTSGAGGRNPEFCRLFVGVVFESIHQAEFLNRT